MYYYKAAVLGQSTFTYCHDTPLDKGSLVTVSLRNKDKTAVILDQTDKPEYKTKPVQSIGDKFFTPSQLQLASFIASYYFCDLAVALNIFTPHSSGQKPFSLQEKINKPKLTDVQQAVYDKLMQKSPALLFGVTGSGKTEIYIEAIHKQLRQNKTALVLMPEISLTPQIQKRMQHFFGDVVGVWHSKLTKKQRTEFLTRLYEGKIGLVVGARSALFLPHRNLGLIIVDEEHDDSYKANNKPRYHARDMAIYYAHRQNIPVILGSATPSLSSYEKFHTVKLTQTFTKTQKHYRFFSGNEFDQFLLDQLQQNKNDQSILFLPTRGNFKYLHCTSCGEFVKCPYCSVGMSLHFKHKALKCHYCGFTEAIPQSCPSCHDVSLSSKRIGTAEVIKTIQESSDLSPQQFDTDTITTATKLKKALSAFEKGETNVLVGTQMLSKGHDYPNVTLAIIMGLDFLLARADFRAREKAMALFLQIAGRSGRNKDARILVQSDNEGFFQSYLHDYEAFLQDEKAFRQGLYPPYTTLARLLFAHGKDEVCKQRMEKVLHKLQENNCAEIVGAGPNAIEKIAGRYRYHILLRTTTKAAMQKCIAGVYEGSFEVDMDCIFFD